MHLSPAETAKRFGVSIKALRLYEQRGLLAPTRTTNGATGSAWRVYGPEQIARLHQILALKRLGLSLARIGQVLAGPDALGSVLALQEEALARDAAHLARALGLVKAARAKLAAGDMLSIDDLANLTRETVMTRMDAKDMSQTLKPFADRHLSGDEKDAYRARLTIDLETLRRAVNDLMQEAQPLMEVGDHTCPAAQNLAGRWRVAQSFPKADSDMRAKVCATWADAMADPAVGQKLALNRDIFRFVQQAVDHHKALEK